MTSTTREGDQARPTGVRTRVEHIMGTAISIAVRTGDGGDPEAGADAAVDAAFAALRRADELFSPFLPDSEVSRLRDGRLAPEGCDPDVAAVLTLCERLRLETGGYFDAYAHPDGLDPCGVVKGWAVECASALLAAAGVTDHHVSAGGDVRLRGQPSPYRPWRVGIADPHRPGNLLAVVDGNDLVVATSGTAEQGLHVLDPHTGTPAHELASVTVVGPSLTEADAYATAALAMGRDALEWLAGLDGHEAFVVTEDGNVWWTDGFPCRVLPDAARS
jgi:thiamine biosynthesis lipoprotein